MAKTQIHIAIIEDNQDLREELIFFLQAQGHAVWGTDSAEHFWKQLHRAPADIVLVDIGLPGEDGFGVISFLHNLKRHGVIVITARGAQQDRLRGLNLGADFYLVKPVNFSELNQSVIQLWNRIQAESADSSLPSSTTSGSWALHDRILRSPEGQELILSPKEVLLIEVLLRNRNSICSKELLHDCLFGHSAEPDTHRIDVVISRLRRKARQNHFHLPIRALFGKGLTFVDQLDQSFV